jgi:hypothetical protein
VAVVLLSFSNFSVTGPLNAAGCATPSHSWVMATLTGIVLPILKALRVPEA